MAAPKGNKYAGNRKGVPNKVTKELKDMILGALDDAGGQAYLAQQAIDNPGPFIALVGKVLPMSIKSQVDGTLEITWQK